MNSHTRISTTVVCLFATLMLCASLSAQQQAPSPPTTYTVFPLRTLGGPQSNVTPYARVIGGSQVMAGSADTGDINPNYPNANGLIGTDPYVQHAATAHGSMHDLGALPGGPNSSTALAINGSGTVTGISENGVIDPLIGSPEGRAVIWKNGQITDLGTLGGNESVGWGVNSSDQVAGCAANAIPDDNSAFGWGTQTRAFLYQNGSMQDLGTLGGTDACATMLNDAGQVAGFAYTASGDFDSFIWANQQMKDIGNLGGTFGYPNSMNNSGQVTGASNLAGDSITHAYLWDGTAIHDLGSLSSGTASNFSEGIWINNAGHVVGDSLFSPVASHAVLWKNGTMTDLGTLPGDLCSIAWGINSHDQVVGGSGLCGSPQHAFLWQNGQMYDLTHVLPLNAVMTSAFYIDDAGEIAVVGNVGHGGNGAQAYTTVQRAFLLVPAGGGLSDAGLANQNSAAPPAEGTRSRNNFGRYRPPALMVTPQD